MTVCIINIPNSKLSTSSMTKQQEYDVENDLNGLNLYTYKPKLFHGSIKNHRSTKLKCFQTLPLEGCTMNVSSYLVNNIMLYA